jgi:hypothetical protein
MKAYLEMEMPKCCRDCRFITYPGHGAIACTALDGIIAFDDDEVFKPWKHRLKACPLSKIPADHGRLIDADALTKQFLEDNTYFTNEIEYEIKTAPTIIPAEPPKEEP